MLIEQDLKTKERAFLLAEKGLSLIELPELATEEYFDSMDTNTEVEVDKDGNFFMIVMNQ